MKMAKASAQEIQDAILLTHLTESACHPRFYSTPAFPDTDESAGESFDYNSKKDLQKFFDRVQALTGGLQRVVFGFQVLIDNCCDPAKDVLDWKPELIHFAWQKELPQEIGLWWWWNEDEDSAPIAINIAYSGTDGTYFATEGQYGWTRFQQVEEMGGWWKRLPDPALPNTEAE